MPPNKRRKHYNNDYDDNMSQEPENHHSTKSLKNQPLVGTCTEIEKDYYRITSDVNIFSFYEKQN